ncbi:MAG: hypothetical protein PHC34_13080 [Candidatus Gastranaerophilales bacterium]|nr:hypothetical protein [Candidatus Gastranaerophilales bacterium]
MAGNIYNLYPQFIQQTDRRTQNNPVAVHCRSGIDRRELKRPSLDVKLMQDIEKVKDTFTSITKNHKELVAFAVSPIPGLRRIDPVEENNDKGNPFKAAGLGLIGLINLKEDLRDILTISGKSKSLAEQGYFAKYGFFTGTSIEKWLKKSDWGRFILREIDSTLAENSIARKILTLIGITWEEKPFKKEIKHLDGSIETVLRKYVKFEGSQIGKTIGLTLYRIPKLSLLAMFVLEIPNIINAPKKDQLKQTTNSLINTTLGIGCGALCSALLAPIHPALSVMGLGLGYYVGSKLSKVIGNKLNGNIQSNAG